MHVSLRRIDARRWCVVDARFPSDDARCLIGYVELFDRVYHAIRLDGTPIAAYDEPDLQSVLEDLDRPRAQ
jgi:hypothetical protein